MKYRTKPIIVEAVQWDGENFLEVEAILPVREIGLSILSERLNILDVEFFIDTRNGFYVHKDEWVVAYQEDGLTRAKRLTDDAFHSKYEPVEEAR